MTVKRFQLRMTGIISTRPINFYYQHNRLKKLKKNFYTQTWKAEKEKDTFVINYCVHITILLFA